MTIKAGVWSCGHAACAAGRLHVCMTCIHDMHDMHCSAECEVGAVCIITQGPVHKRHRPSVFLGACVGLKCSTQQQQQQQQQDSSIVMALENIIRVCSPPVGCLRFMCDLLIMT